MEDETKAMKGKLATKMETQAINRTVAEIEKELVENI